MFRLLFGWHGFVLISFLSAQTVFSQTTYEAESAALSQGAYSDNCPTCSGGKEVKYIGGDHNGMVTFNVNVPSAGLYPMTVFYNVGDERPFTITVNANAQYDLMFAKTTRPGSDADSSRVVFVPLNAGKNTVAFSNAEEFAPDLDCIVIGAAPVESKSISGSVTNATGAHLTNAEVFLSGDFFRMKTVTDALGRYEFPFLPAGNYYVRPKLPGTFFSPYEKFCAATDSNVDNQNFVVRKWAGGSKKISVMQLGQWRIEYGLADGLADIFYGGKLVIPQAFPEVRLPETMTSMDYQNRKITQQTIRDGFGRGVKFIVESDNGGAEKMIQTFYLYKNADYFLTEVAIAKEPKAVSNFMAPLVSQTPSDFLPAGNDCALFVPFDNDKWIRYAAVPFGSEVTSYEVSALYDNASQHGLIVGSIEHDTWKTGVETTTSSNAITSMEIFGGVTSPETRDVLPHGKISGQTIRSPKIFVGCYSDWRDGLEAYAKANAVVAPPRVWNGGVPFGWNSWGKLQDKISYAKAVQVSDFIAKELPQFENDGVVYVGLDSGWNKFSDAQLKEFVDHCQANHQEAGIYFTPFAVWRANADAPVPGTNYKYKDLYLYANGRKEMLDGGVALDPTHPGTKALIAATIARFKKAGFKYVKADFLTQGALEADHYYDPKVTTGVEAYNEGMKFVSETLGEKVYLNQSISPLFPAQYADSRRIACDTFGGISQVEYELNSLTYGWWLDDVYDFNDPDHIVLDGYSKGENRARVTSAAITGLFISGDDFSSGGSAAGKDRAKEFLNNPEVNDVAKIKKSFRPVGGNYANQAANLFAYRDKSNFYLAAFNYSKTNASFNVSFDQLGIKAKGPIKVKELWSGAVENVSSPVTIRINSTDAKFYEFYNVQE